MTYYSVTGMTCAACQSHVEKAVKKVDGVQEVSVSLLTNSMQVEGTAAPEQVIRAVEDAGYGASVRGKGANKGSGNGLGNGGGNSAGNSVGNSAGNGAENGAGRGTGSGTGNGARVSDIVDLSDHETPKLLRRLIGSLTFLLPLMYVSMGHMMWGWPLPSVIAKSHVNMGLIQLILSAIVMLINKKFFVSGFRGLLHRAPNMDTLVAIGSGAAFVYSTARLFGLALAIETGDAEAASAAMHDLYFESAAMILSLITVGKLLEAYSKGRTTNALKSLIELAPKTATVLREGKEVTIPAEEVEKGDVFVVRPGESIPVDGTVRDGSGAVNEAALTGESLPVDKLPGSFVSAGTVNQSGFLTCEASQVGEDTTLAQIIRLVSDAAATKAPIAKIADKVSAVFVPAVMSIALVTFIGWLIAGREVGFAMARGISVLVISCPCALGLATPVAIMVGSGKAARNGILFKTASSLETVGKVGIVVLDKTGTITEGQPKVVGTYGPDGERLDGSEKSRGDASPGSSSEAQDDIQPGSSSEAQDDVQPGSSTEALGSAALRTLLETSVSLERKSEHPLAKAVVSYGEELQAEAKEASSFLAEPGNGLRAVIGGKQCFGGNAAYIGRKAKIRAELQARAEELSSRGCTPLFFAADGTVLGMIAVSDTVKSSSREAVDELKHMGIKTVMLTGDNARTAMAIRDEVGVDEVVAGVLPAGKEAVISALQEGGQCVAMVGDGINDAPALTRAEVGIAIGAGTDVAIDAADVVLMKGDLKDVSAAVRLSRRVILNIRENLFWAFIYNCIGIPLAIGLLIPWGITLNPMFGAAAMSLSSFCVVTNALRLNLLKVYSAKRDGKIKKEASLEALKNFGTAGEESKEDKNMKTVRIDGMMCMHCEKHMKDALEALGLTVASVSHEAKAAVVEDNAGVTDEMIAKAVADAGYEFLGIE